MDSAFQDKLDQLDEEAFQSLYGRWDPIDPHEAAALFAGTPIKWWIAGGHATRVDAAPRHHDDLDVAVALDDLDAVRAALADWHLWESNDGTLRPLLPGDSLTEGCEQLWVRRSSQHPWQLDLLLDRSPGTWVFKRDPSVAIPWDRALHTVDGVRYLRPELALLHKAHLDRPKDRADLVAASLDPVARIWLAQTLRALGYEAWARIATHES